MNKDTKILIMVMIRGMNFTLSKMDEGGGTDTSNIPIIVGMRYTVGMLEKWKKGGNPLG